MYTSQEVVTVRTQGISALVEGMNIDDVISRLKVQTVTDAVRLVLTSLQ